jgi:hypothetical protein
MHRSRWLNGRAVIGSWNRVAEKDMMVNIDEFDITVVQRNI